MKFALLGGESECDQKNSSLFKSILDLSPVKNPRITFIPACSYDCEYYFHHFMAVYKKFNINKFLYFPIDLEFSETLLHEAFSADIIYLSGGNTFYFLNVIRQKKLKKYFKSFLQRGGVLSGLSAGAIVMTPNIATASFPEFDKDDNDEGLRDFTALNFLDFEFFPHYKNSRRYDDELLAHSLKTPRALYASSDGSGMFLNQGNIYFHGRNYLFFKGKKTRLIIHRTWS